jgi:hypothetical protein
MVVLRLCTVYIRWGQASGDSELLIDWLEYSLSLSCSLSCSLLLSLPLSL